MSQRLPSNSPPLPRELDVKVICVGAANTGKTTFLRYWEKGESAPFPSTTIQMEFHRREMTIPIPPFPRIDTRDGQHPSTQTNTPKDATKAPNDTFTTHAKSTSSDATHIAHSGSAVWCVGQTQTSSSASPPVAEDFGIPISPSRRRGSPYASFMHPFGDAYLLTPPSLPDLYQTFSPSQTAGWRSVPAIVKIWDIQGQENTKKMTRLFYTGAMAVLIFCEVSASVDSLTSALSWRSDVAQKMHTPPSPPCWLVVNKFDTLHALPSPPEWARRGALDALCARHGFHGWSYTVGREGVNVEETLHALMAAAVEAFPTQMGTGWHVNGENGENAAFVPRTRSRQRQPPQRECCGR